VSGDNTADCSPAMTSQNGDAVLMNSVSDDCVVGSQQSNAGTVTVCV